MAYTDNITSLPLNLQQINLAIPRTYNPKFLTLPLDTQAFNGNEVSIQKSVVLSNGENLKDKIYNAYTINNYGRNSTWHVKGEDYQFAWHRERHKIYYDVDINDKRTIDSVVNETLDQMAIGNDAAIWNGNKYNPGFLNNPRINTMAPIAVTDPTLIIKAMGQVVNQVISQRSAAASNLVMYITGDDIQAQYYTPIGTNNATVGDLIRSAFANIEVIFIENNVNVDGVTRVLVANKPDIILHQGTLAPTLTLQTPDQRNDLMLHKFECDISAVEIRRDGGASVAQLNINIPAA